MPKPITRFFTYAGILLFLVIATSAAIAVWPVRAQIDYRFWKLLSIVGAVFVYFLTTLITARTPCYWLAVLLAKLEAHQRMLLRVAKNMLRDYRVQYPHAEREVRKELGNI